MAIDPVTGARLLMNGQLGSDVPSALTTSSTTSSITSLPQELQSISFEFLSADSLYAMSKTCKHYKQVMDSLWLSFSQQTPEQLSAGPFPGYREIGPEFWTRHFELEGQDGLKSRGARFPQLQPPNRFDLIRKLVHIYGVAQIKGNAGVTLLFVPGNLTIPLIQGLSSYRRPASNFAEEGLRILFETHGHKARTDPHQGPVQQARYILITNNLLEETIGQNEEAQQAYLSTIRASLPKVIDVFALMQITFISRPAEQSGLGRTTRSTLFVGSEADQLLLTNTSDRVVDYDGRGPFRLLIGGECMRQHGYYAYRGEVEPVARLLTEGEIHRDWEYSIGCGATWSLESRPVAQAEIRRSPAGQRKGDGCSIS